MLRSLFLRFVCSREYLWKFVGFLEMKMLLLTSVKCMMQTTGALTIEFSSYLTGSGVHLRVTYLQILPILKVKKFYSKFVDGLSTGIDAFSFDWKFDNNWIVPPVRLISRVISHLIACKATGVLDAPKWSVSPFWSCIVNNDGTFKDVVIECVEFKEPSRFFVRGSHWNSVFNVVFNVVVLRLDAREL